MYAEINCLDGFDSKNTKLWESTKALIGRKTEHLTKTHPDVDRSEIHLFSKGHKSRARLIFHDQKHRRLEAHAKDRNLNKAISDCFSKAERLLAKPKHLQKKIS